MRRPLLAALLAAPLLATTNAQAATLTADRACYRENQTMQLSVTGFPQELIGFTGDEQPLRGAYGSNGQEGYLIGDGTIGVQAPFSAGFTSGLLHLVADTTVTSPNGEQQRTIATRDVRLVDTFRADSQPAAARPNRTVTYVVSGAVELKPLYLHVFRETTSGGRRKRIQRDFLLGTPQGPCGSLRKRMREVGTTPIVHRASFSRTIDMLPHGAGASVDDQRPSKNLLPVYAP